MTALSDNPGGRGTLVYGLQVAFPGSTLRFAASSYTSLSLGHFAGKVTNWGGLEYKISDRSGRLNPVTTRVTISDTDRVIARIYEGASRDEVRGSVATIYLLSPGTTPSASDIHFLGIVTKVSFPDHFRVELTLCVADDHLKRFSPRGGWALNAINWPDAKPDVYDKMAPVLYGTFDSSTMRTSPGLLPTLYVDTRGYKYLLCAGKAKSITRVFVDGVETASGWSTAYVTKAGRIYTCIDFTANQGDAVITADATGYEDVGDGSGTLITNPATQWAHRLTNFSLGDWMTGSWLSTNALIDSTSLAAAEDYFDLLTMRGSCYDAEKITGYDIIAAYCNSFRMRAYWTLGGKIASGYENIFALPYTGTRWRWYRDSIGPMSLVEDDFQVTSREVIHSCYSPVDGEFLQSLEVMDASVADDTQGSLDLNLSEAA